MPKIDVSLKDGQVAITIQGDEPEPSIWTMPRDVALQIGTALIGLSERAEETLSSFNEPPMMVVTNPPIQVSRSDAGQIILAVLPKKLRPILIQLGPSQIAQLREFLGDEE